MNMSLRYLYHLLGLLKEEKKNNGDALLDISMEIMCYLPNYFSTLQGEHRELTLEAIKYTWIYFNLTENPGKVKELESIFNKVFAPEDEFNLHFLEPAKNIIAYLKDKHNNREKIYQDFNLDKKKIDEMINIIDYLSA